MSVKVRSIYLYPIKGLDPHRVKQAKLTEKGSLEGDRSLALFDKEGRVISGKREPLLHKIRAEYDLENGEVHLAGKEKKVFDLDDLEGLSDWFSTQLGYGVSVKRFPEGFPDDRKAHGPTIISLGTLEEISRWFGFSLEECRRRFRANIELDSTEPFWEDRLVGDHSPVRFKIGDVIMEGYGISKRCPVPTRNPWTGQQTKGFVKIFTENRKKTLPNWSPKERFKDTFYRLSINTVVSASQKGKLIKVGDELTFCDS
jgi:uncharacterized protein YcbX